MKTYLTLIFPLFLLSSCGCKDTYTYLDKEDKQWIPYKDGEKIRFLINNKDTVEYLTEITASRQGQTVQNYGSKKKCTEEGEYISVRIMDLKNYDPNKEAI